uniref:U11/U12 small nuclear ribonucleoprotein 25 kDa protein-like n=1 Tax=Styela clava TaxID=7725 RepID=UPI0019393F19|nr:U11/U12 small nuclear ribonucleoprotein 25 kDa protein-like [Styela clava]
MTEEDSKDIFKEKLDEMLGDPLLYDIKDDITIEEINSLIDLEYGRAMTITVNRADGDCYTVIVNQNGTVKDIKSAINRHFMLKMQRENGPKHISWKYVWRTYWLYFDGQKLRNDKDKLKTYGIRNNDTVCFIKRLREK